MHPRARLARTPIAEIDDGDRAEDPAAQRQREEQEVIALCVAGAPDHYRILVDRYKRAVLAVTYRLIGNRHEAEELAQQTFVNAFDALPRFRPGYRFSSWLYRIAVNNCKDYLKSKKRTETTLVGDVPGDAGHGSAAITDPETALAERERGERIMAAIERLPAKYGTVLVLKDIEELSYEEIRGILGRPITTLKIRVVRARRMLRDLLAPEDAP